MKATITTISSIIFFIIIAVTLISRSSPKFNFYSTSSGWSKTATGTATITPLDAKQFAGVKINEDEDKMNSNIDEAKMTLIRHERKQYCIQKYNDGKAHAMHEVIRIVSLQKSRSIIFLDIGTHEGTISFPLLLCLPIRHKVISVEPVKANQHFLLSLSKKFALYNGLHYYWKLLPFALSNHTASNVQIYIPNHRTDNAALNFNASINYVGSNNNNLSTDSIRTYRGDDLFYSDQNQIIPDFIKIDVQGMEYLVLSGLDQILSLKTKKHMVVMVEYDPYLINKYQLTPFHIVEYMINKDFKAYCHPQFNVRNGYFYVENKHDIITVQQAKENKIPSTCPDLFFVK